LAETRDHRGKVERVERIVADGGEEGLTLLQSPHGSLGPGHAGPQHEAHRVARNEPIAFGLIQRDPKDVEKVADGLGREAMTARSRENGTDVLRSEVAEAAISGLPEVKPD
jgi:hypothetical protein